MGKLLISILGTAVSVVTAKVTQHFLDKGYEKVKSEKAPSKNDDIEDKNTFIRIAKWSIFSSIIVGLMKVATTQLTKKSLPSTMGEKL